MMDLDSSVGFFTHISNAYVMLGISLYVDSRPFHDVIAHGFSNMTVLGWLDILHVAQGSKSKCKVLWPFIT